jgi:hypothetical protein
MLDKDGVGFRFVTVEDPVCIQLIPTDPDIGGYPVLRIGRTPAPIINYPLTNDAYVMNDAGETISKVSLKECLREVGKEQFRPDRKGLAELPPFEEQHRKVISDSLRMGSLSVNIKTDDPVGLVKEMREAFNGTDKNPNGNRPRQIQLDPSFRRIEASEEKWWVYNGDKLIDVLMLGARDLATLNACVSPNDRVAFDEYLILNWSGKAETLQGFQKEIARNNKLYDAYMLVAGTTVCTATSFTPLMPDPELGAHLYALINGQKVHVSALTMGDVIINNVFYLNPLSVDPTVVDCDPEIMTYMLAASTVYFHARPEERTDETGIKGWIDYAFHDSKYNVTLPKSAVGEEIDSTIEAASTGLWKNAILSLTQYTKNLLGNPALSDKIQLLQIRVTKGSVQSFRTFITRNGVAVRMFWEDREDAVTDEAIELIKKAFDNPRNYFWFNVYLDVKEGYDSDLIVKEVKSN